MTPEQVQTITCALGVLMGAAYLIWKLPGTCRCADCPTHVRAREEEKKRQAEVQHDSEHKGFGFKSTWPDRFDCREKACRRNGKVD